MSSTCDGVEKGAGLVVPVPHLQSNTDWNRLLNRNPDTVLETVQTLVEAMGSEIVKNMIKKEPRVLLRNASNQLDKLHDLAELFGITR